MKYERKNEYQAIKIESIDEIYGIISEYNNFWSSPRKECGEEVRTFYRGQSNSRWSIQPSLLRSGKKECEVIAESSDYNRSLFELISRIQHYKTGTRFIDFSTDPDVAMFFACSENSNSDGALFLQLFLCHEPDWYTTCAVCELSKIPENKISVKEFAERLIDSDRRFAERFSDTEQLSFALMSFLEYGIPVVPSEKETETNARMRNQKGCFFICGVDFVPKLEENQEFRRLLSYSSKNAFKPHSAVVPDSLIVPLNAEKQDRAYPLKSGNGLVKIVITRELKKDILSYLSKEKNITREYLFPD